MDCPVILVPCERNRYVMPRRTSSSLQSRLAFPIATTVRREGKRAGAIALPAIGLEIGGKAGGGVVR